MLIRTWVFIDRTDTRFRISSGRSKKSGIAYRGKIKSRSDTLVVEISEEKKIEGYPSPGGNFDAHACMSR